MQPYDYVPSMYWYILCWMENFFIRNKRMPSYKEIRETFKIQQNLGVKKQIDRLVEMGYLAKDPSYKSGQARSNLMFTNLRFNCNCLQDLEWMMKFESHTRGIETILKPRTTAELDEIGTGYVGN